MKLSEDFSYDELIATSTGFSNEPIPKVEEKLLYLANYLLQPIRDRWGAIKVSSGYRSIAVNRAVGGSHHSQHTYGEAADIVPVEADIKDVYRWIVEDSRLKFGQAIYEHRGNSTWIHISLVRTNKPNGEELVYDGRSYRKYEGKL